jgi:hypothetical protein
MASTITRTMARLGFSRLTKERGAAMPSGLNLQDKNGNDWCLWFDTTGDLRTAEAATVEAAAFNPESSGTVLGTQS